MDDSKRIRIPLIILNVIFVILAILAISLFGYWTGEPKWVPQLYASSILLAVFSTVTDVTVFLYIYAENTRMRLQNEIQRKVEEERRQISERKLQLERERQIEKDKKLELLQVFETSGRYTTKQQEYVMSWECWRKRVNCGDWRKRPTIFQQASVWAKMAL